jgi:hypothetical protein
MKNGILFCSVLLVMGFLDWLTTIVGKCLIGASESNPVLSVLINNNVLVFSIMKLSAVAIVGLLFYKAEAIGSSSKYRFSFDEHIVNAGYLFSLVALTAVVTSNMIIVAKIV